MVRGRFVGLFILTVHIVSLWYLSSFLNVHVNEPESVQQRHQPQQHQHQHEQKYVDVVLQRYQPQHHEQQVTKPRLIFVDSEPGDTQHGPISTWYNEEAEGFGVCQPPPLQPACVTYTNKTVPDEVEHPLQRGRNIGSDVYDAPYCVTWIGNKQLASLGTDYVLACDNPKDAFIERRMPQCIVKLQHAYLWNRQKTIDLFKGSSIASYKVRGIEWERLNLSDTLLKTIFFNSTPEPLPYLMVIPNAFVDDRGNVFDCLNQYRLLPPPCIGYRTPRSEKFWSSLLTNCPKVDKLFVALERTELGDGPWHVQAEGIGRIGFFIDFIIKNNISVQITKIHTPILREMMEFMGVQPNRILEETKILRKPSGLRADLIYLPPTSKCGHPNALSIRAWHHSVQRRLAAHLGAQEKDQKRSIVIIKRGTRIIRAIINHDDMLKTLQTTFPNETFMIHTGEESLIEQWTMFYRAKIVIGSHGSGFVNTIACQDDVEVVEVLDPIINMCYIEFSAFLGLKGHHLLLPKEKIGNRLLVNIDKLINVIKVLLK